MKYVKTTIKAAPEYKLWKNGGLVAEFATKEEMMEAYETHYNAIKNQGRNNQDLIEAVEYNTVCEGAWLSAANAYFFG